MSRRSRSPSWRASLLPRVHQLARPLVVGSGLVFPSTEGTPLRRENFRRRWCVPATKRAGLQGLRFHDLRHTTVSLAIAAGSHPKQIQERLGHTSVTVTLDRYGHLFPTLGEQVADGLERAFRQSLADPVRTNGGPGVVVLPVAEGSHTL